MTAHHALANVAALVGEPTRAAILLALIDGRARPAGELAREAGLSASATSLHLAKLTDGELLIVRKEGRHRYYRLANDEVAHALEALGVSLSPWRRPSSGDTSSATKATETTRSRVQARAGSPTSWGSTSASSPTVEGSSHAAVSIGPNAGRMSRVRSAPRSSANSRSCVGSRAREAHVS
jgi:DNA-binding transcriptional ArsR family regulator